MKDRNGGLNEMKQAMEDLMKLKYQLSYRQTERKESTARMGDFRCGAIAGDVKSLLTTDV